MEGSRIKDLVKRETALIQALVTVLLVSALVAAGCAGGKYATPGIVDVSAGEKIAIMPLENYTVDQYAHEKVRRALISELVSRGIDVIEPGEVSRAITELKIKNLNALTVNDFQALGRELHVGKLIVGSVSTYGISRGLTLTYPEVSMNLMIVETETGSIMQSVFHTAGGADFWTKHFGIEGLTLSEIETRAVAGSVDLLFGK